MSKSLTFQGLNNSPNSIEAEIAVLGGLILDNEAWEQIADILQVNDFYNQEHRKIYSCIVNLVNDNIPFDIVTINVLAAPHQHVGFDISLHISLVLSRAVTAVGAR